MALYLGSEKLQINLVDGVWRLAIPSPSPITNGIILVSFDNYILKDSNGLFLVAKEDK